MSYSFLNEMRNTMHNRTTTAATTHSNDKYRITYLNSFFLNYFYN